MLLKIDAQGAEGRVLDGTARLWPRIAAVQLELSMVALYDSEPSWRLMVERMEALGFTLGLVIPGYYEHKLGRQLQFDGVFWREPLPEPAADRRRDHP
jgi:hypothetical protein